MSESLPSPADAPVPSGRPPSRWRRWLTPGEPIWSRGVQQAIAGAALVAGLGVALSLAVPVLERAGEPGDFGGMPRRVAVQGASLEPESWLPRLPGWQTLRVEGLPCFDDGALAYALLALHLQRPPSERRLIRVYAPDAGPLPELRVLVGDRRALLATLRSDLAPATIHIEPGQAQRCAGPGNGIQVQRAPQDH